MKLFLWNTVYNFHIRFWMFLLTTPNSRTIEDHLEASNGVLQRHQFTLGAREHLGHLERLAEESLDLASTRDRQLIIF